MLSLETALVVPVLVLALGLALQLSWLGFQTACFDHAVNSAAWKLRSERTLSGDATTIIKQAIADDWTPLNQGAISVSNANVSVVEHSASTPTSGELDRHGYLIERTTRFASTVRTQATVSYVIDPIVALPGFGSVEIERQLDRSFVAQSRFEVS